MPYFYKGQPVELIESQLFDTHWNFWMEVGGRRIIGSGTPGIDLFEGDSPPLTPIPSDNKAEVLPLLPNASTSVEVQVKSGDRLNINQANYSLIRKFMPGIGRSAPKKLIDNKPEGGYRDFAHLKECNAELQINWDVVESVIVFE
jgi:hypothetical protein